MDVASLRIAIQTGDIKKAEQELGKLEASAKKTEKATDSLGVGFAAAGTVVVATLGAIFRASVQSAIEAENASNKMQAVLKATGYAAGLTKMQLDEMADSMAASTRFDDESIRNASSVLLTFRNVQGDTFREGIGLAADLASVLGTDLNSAALQVGKALNDPVQGISALSRAGVQFSEIQKDQIKGFVETNQLAKAQEIILGELRSQVGGTAEAMNTGLTKATTDAAKAWGEFTESVGKSAEVQTTTVGTLDFISGRLKSLTEDINRTGSVWAGFVDFVFAPFDANLLGFDDGTRQAKEYSDEIERMQRRIATLGAEKQRQNQADESNFMAEKERSKEREKLAQQEAKERKRIEDEFNNERIKIQRQSILDQNDARQAADDEYWAGQKEQAKQVNDFLVMEAERRYEEDFRVTEELAKRQIKAAEDLAKENKRVSEDLRKDMQGALQRAFERGGNIIEGFAEALSSVVYSRLSSSLADALANAALNAFSSSGNSGNSGFSSIIGAVAGAFGGGGASNVPIDGYDGGGFTGMGSRSGGMDGKGGFMAMLHPNETVIDHSKGQTGGIVFAPVISVDARADRGQALRETSQLIQNYGNQLVDQLTRQRRLA